MRKGCGLAFCFLLVWFDLIDSIQYCFLLLSLETMSGRKAMKGDDQ